ncbi:MAG: hydrolase [Gemmatimonadaceae bacterium]
MSKPDYEAPWWLPGPHLQTLWGKLFRRPAIQPTRAERLDTPDGDFLDIHHLEGPPGAPLLVLLHGLEGGLRSHYIQGLLGEARSRGWRAAVIIFRSCGGQMNRAKRSYHSGETADLGFALTHLTTQPPASPILLAGASLGGNVLLKYLGEQGRGLSPRIRGAVAISVPFDLSRSSRYIDRGFARVYQYHFLRSLRRKARIKAGMYPGMFPVEKFGTVRTMYDFDDSFTAPAHGFLDADDYYRKSSSLGWIENISVNTLLLSAIDDPFLPEQVLDEVRDVAAGNPFLHTEFSAQGGHVGFVTGPNPFSPTYYLEKRAGDFLARQIEPASAYL